MIQVPLDVQIACVRREVRLRRTAYAQWVPAGTMDEATAAKELRAVQVVLQTLTALLEGSQGELFVTQEG